jgi:hypothetical protein
MINICRWVIPHRTTGLDTNLALEGPMVTLPTPEQCATAILAIYVWHFGLLAGDVLFSKSFLALWEKRGYQLRDFKAGVEFALESGWLELLPGGKSYRLTRSGVDHA